MNPVFAKTPTDIILGSKSHPGIVWMMRKGIGKKFSHNNVPYTHHTVAKRIVTKLDPKPDTTVLVFYTLEIAARLSKQGVKDVTVTTSEYCRETHLLTEQLGYKYSLLEDIDMKFDVVVGNPPYTDGQAMLYAKFFKRALELGDQVAFIMPVQLTSRHAKLRAHNERVQRHMTDISENLIDYFDVGYANIQCVYASPYVNNEVPENIDPLDDIPLLYPERKRLKTYKGCGKVVMCEEDANGTPFIHKIHKGDTIVYRHAPAHIVAASDKFRTSPYIVVVNHTPSRGKFNCVVVDNADRPILGAWTFSFDCDTLEEANKLKEHLQSPEIVEYINTMLVARDNQHTISKAMIERLPYYE